jgi:hypothetical protein
MTQGHEILKGRRPRVVLITTFLLLALVTFYHHHPYASSIPYSGLLDLVPATALTADAEHVWPEQINPLDIRSLNLTSNLTTGPPISKWPWDDAAEKQKGEMLLCFLEDPSRAGRFLSTSRWDDYAQLDEWGWTSTELAKDYSYVSDQVCQTLDICNVCVC